ncbi:MAG: hypothetical protein ACTSX1_15155 [Candidatus Heimdallarchaeaceae archaeon]
MKVEMALCFLDEDGNIVAREDLDVSWNLNLDEEQGKISDIFVMDEVAAMLNHKAQEDLYARIRGLLDKVKGINK